MTIQSATLGTAVCLALLLSPVGSAAAAEPVDSEMVARKLAEATVTIRVGQEKAGNEDDAVDSVTVSSGISLGQGLVVTFRTAPAVSKYRITLPSGEQDEGQLRVVDLYSGLSLLQIKRDDLPALKICQETPQVGAPVLTAAAAGIERPVVSMGILGGADRTLSGAGLPPLLQCDVRTTSTSGGAAVVNRHAQLLGVVAVIAAPGQRDAWTYVVPVRHVMRLVRAKVNDKVVVLRRQRPTLGMTMGPGRQDGPIRIDRLVKNGPAQKAGIQQGDEVLEIDGLKVRTVYQAVSLVLKKQPGDRMEFLVQRDGEKTEVPVVLGGRTVLEASQVVAGGPQFYVPELRVGKTADNVIQIQRGRPHVQEVAADPDVPRDDLGLLDAQVRRFAAYIEKLRQDLQKRDAEGAKNRELIDSLQREVAKLQQQLGKQRDAAAKPSK